MYDPRDLEQMEPLMGEPQPLSGLAVFALGACLGWLSLAAIYQTCQSIAWLWRIIFGS